MREYNHVQRMVALTRTLAMALSNDVHDRAQAAMLNCIAWLVRLAGLELFDKADTQLLSAKELFQALFLPPTATITIADDLTRGNSGSAERAVVLALLERVDMAVEQVDAPNFDKLNIDHVNQVYQQTTMAVTTMGTEAVPACNVRRMQALLLRDIEAGFYGGVDNRDALLMDLQLALATAVDNNVVAERRGARLHVLKALERVVAIAFARHNELIKGHSRVQLLCDILTQVLAKSYGSQQGQEPALLSVSSSIVLLLLATLRQTLLELDHPDDVADAATSIIRNVEEPLLSGVVQGVLSAECGPRTRQNHYSTLHFYMQITKHATNPNPNDWIRNPSQRFMDAVCRDACDTAGILSILAMAALAELLALDVQGRWLAFMQRYGYLQHYADEVNSSEQALSQLLLPSAPSNFNALYKHQARFALFLRCADTAHGVQALREANLLPIVAQLKFFPQRPSSMTTPRFGHASSRDTGVPAPLERHRDLVLPVLQLCARVLQTVRTVEVAREVLQFFHAHSSRYFRTVIRVGCGSMLSFNTQLMLCTVGSFGYGNSQGHRRACCRHFVGLLAVVIPVSRHGDGPQRLR
jgi:hypothetical protein